jgi:hypothetical protein
VFVEWHPKLVELVMWVVDFTGEVVITSGYRPDKIHKADSGIHTKIPLRAIDIRHYIYSNPQGLCDAINNKFKYDPLRYSMRCAILHDGLGKHIHLQVHGRTKQGGAIT